MDERERRISVLLKAICEQVGEPGESLPVGRVVAEALGEWCERDKQDFIKGDK